MSAAAEVLAEASPRRRLRIDIRGVVQGVGFRPFVYRCAARLGVAGWVSNTPAGVRLEAEAAPATLDAFLAALRAEAPPHARIDAIDTAALPPRHETVFEIRTSGLASEAVTIVPPDLATCADCLCEIFDPANRRHLYPFTNCTNCGPRYSIVEDLPYDRSRTAMRVFPMCGACAAEYADPADRRFHAEPNACPQCGPQLALWDATGRTRAMRDAALREAVAAVAAGAILALKGLGGFQLVVDAGNGAAVARLRQRKRRSDKPFAVMFPSLAVLERVCVVSPLERGLLQSPAAPIVLLRRRPPADGIAEAVAPGNPYIGAFLPYTPLHHLLMRALGLPVVATSGNRAEEPIVTDESAVCERLGGIAECYLVHDRPIVRPIDDSVTRVVAGREMVLRRARGYAPLPVPFAATGAPVLALGGHLKNTVALAAEGRIVASQHVGDLGTVEAQRAFERAAEDLVRLHRAAPRVVACDAHPDYQSSRHASSLGLPVFTVQHHLAHVAAAMAEHGLAGPVLGVAWDGSGYGGDGTVWGGEFLSVAPPLWRRLARFRPFRLPGGEQAVREPRRAALGVLAEAFGAGALEWTDLPPVAAFAAAERTVIAAMLERGLNTPVTSSVGRLFDAVAALLGLRQRTTYEGEAAAELEWAAEAGPSDRRYYTFDVREADDRDGTPRLTVDWLPAIAALIADRRAGVPAASIAAAFHEGLVDAILVVARRSGERRVVLTGGCFQNRYLTERAEARLRRAGFEPFWSGSVPPNDGGLAVGQAAWAAMALKGSMG